MMTKDKVTTPLKVITIPSDAPINHLLWTLDDEREQPVQVCLDLENGHFYVEIDAEYPSERMDVYHGRTLTWNIPVLTPDGANDLLMYLAPKAQEILDGSNLVRDNSNTVGVLNEHAEMAYDHIRFICDDAGDFGILMWMDASSWDDSRTVRDSVRADATDEELDVLATELEEEASADVFVVGLPEYLRGCRALADSKPYRTIREPTVKSTLDTTKLDKVLQEVRNELNH